MLGSAGTGKTYLAMYLAIMSMLSSESPINRVIVVRSAVPVRSIGFLPGSLEEKMEVYELPYVSIASELLGHSKSWETLKSMGSAFIPTSYIRGITLDNAAVVVDEAENMTFQELDSVATRLGYNSRLLLAGDHAQADIGDSGLGRFMSITNGLISRFDFKPTDITRSDFVRDYIIARDS